MLYNKFNRPILWIGLFLFSFSCFSQKIENCLITNHFLQTKNKWSDWSIKGIERQNLMYKIQDKEKNIASFIYQNYMDNNINSSFFSKCFENENLNELKDQISLIFKQETFKFFNQSKSSKLREITNHITKSNSFFPMRARFKPKQGHGDRSAAFHRTSGAMYYVLSELKPNEFHFHMIHELLHKYDEVELYENSIWFSSKKTQEEIYSIASNDNLNSTHIQYQDLSIENQEKLNAFIMAGLKRGLVAELKVWAATYNIYNDLVRVGEIQKIAWVNELLSQQKSQSYLDFLFNYYTPRFKKPERNEDNLFYWDAVQTAFDINIERILSDSNKCEYMDDLKIFIDECR